MAHLWSTTGPLRAHYGPTMGLSKKRQRTELGQKVRCQDHWLVVEAPLSQEGGAAGNRQSSSIV